MKLCIRTIFLVVVMLLIYALSSTAAPAKKPDERQAQLAHLKAQLIALQDSLDTEIASRWDAKQRYLARREADKDEAGGLKEKQEMAYLDLSRVKEELFASERKIEQAHTGLEQKKDEWRYTGAGLDEILERQADAVLDGFPLDYESKRLDVERVRRASGGKAGISKSIEDFLAFKLAACITGTRISVVKTTIVPDLDNAAQNVTVIRFGNVFAYAQGSDGAVYFVRQTGQLGRRRFAIEKISREELSRDIFARFPEWIKTGAVFGNIPVDVLQNMQSRVLSGGEEANIRMTAWKFVKDGGPVMFPLLALPVWAMVLVILKFFQLLRKAADIRAAKKAAAKILLDETGKAVNPPGSVHGPSGRLILACFENQGKDRGQAEKAVKEILSTEVLSLNSHLNTLAVIAGVAPLLGLLGTVTGMIRLFNVITSYGTGDPKMMAAGISEALITTETGLCIAIPILLVHNYLRNRKNRILAEFEKLAIMVLNRLWPL